MGISNLVEIRCSILKKFVREWGEFGRQEIVSPRKTTTRSLSSSVASECASQIGWRHPLPHTLTDRQLSFFLLVSCPFPATVQSTFGRVWLRETRPIPLYKYFTPKTTRNFLMFVLKCYLPAWVLQVSLIARVCGCGTQRRSRDLLPPSWKWAVTSRLFRPSSHPG